MTDQKMHYEVQQDGTDVVILFSGHLAGSLSEKFRQQIRDLCQPGGSLVFDFGGVASLSSTVLRRLLLFARHARSVGCRLSTRAVPEELRHLVAATGFLPIFQQLDRQIELPLLLGENPLRIDAYPTSLLNGFGVRRGDALPFGATLAPRGVNFSLFSRHATAVTLVLYRPGEAQAFAELPIPTIYRLGDTWSIMVFDLDIDDIEYCYYVDGPWAPEHGHRYQPRVPLLDPYALNISGGELWGQLPRNASRRTYRGRVVTHDFDWNGDRPPEHPIEDLLIYEMHVRGFTRHASSQVSYPGTFAGIREKIPYFQELGINCIELMPIFEFDECENVRLHPETGESLCNYWGYSTVGFYAPKASYAATSALGMQSDELKSLIRDLHLAGIEVVLDVVLNHTAELGDDGPTLSFRGLDNRVYYLLDQEGNYLNYSGCGNTVNCNYPVVREFLRSCLRHWVMEYHIDGFRFDLASILGRDTDGRPLANPPLLESLARDAVLSRTKLIAEAWDAGGLYQVGTFPAYGRWMEWNGRYRDTVRRFLRGDPEQVVDLAQRLIGSPDMYQERGPTASVNFVTCHDGFTLRDLVSYEHKHNDANGEHGLDGSDVNDAWNCGVEGPTLDPLINSLRLRQQKNALAMLFLSQGIPMLLMGDEVGRTQSGNNNAYCHDSPLTWLDWDLREQNSELYDFCRLLIQFRKDHPSLRHHRHAGLRSSGLPALAMNPVGDDRAEILDVTWHGVEPFHPDWSSTGHSLALMLRLYDVHGLQDVVYIALNMYWEPLEFRLPSSPDGWQWRKQLDTACAEQPLAGDLSKSPPLQSHQRSLLVSRSVQVFVALPE